MSSSIDVDLVAITSIGTTDVTVAVVLLSVDATVAAVVEVVPMSVSVGVVINSNGITGTHVSSHGNGKGREKGNVIGSGTETGITRDAVIISEIHEVAVHVLHLRYAPHPPPRRVASQATTAAATISTTFECQAK